MKHLRFILALISFCVIFVLIAFPQLLVLSLVYQILNRSESYRRERIAYWTVQWGDLSFRIICRLMKISAHFNLPEPMTTPAIMIANHQSTFDAPLITTIFKRVGFMNPRWVVKKEIFDVFAIGWMSRTTGCIPVSRSKDPKDLERLAVGAVDVYRDRAPIFLFPEGKRFTQVVPGSGLKHLLPPKRGGFAALTSILPTYPVLSVMIKWNGPTQAVETRKLFQLTNLVGTHLTVEGRLIPAEVVAADPDWLIHEWERMDAALAAATN